LIPCWLVYYTHVAWRTNFTRYDRSIYHVRLITRVWLSYEAGEIFYWAVHQAPVV